MAPERGICRVLATSQAVILCAMIREDTRGGYNYALNLVKMAIRLHIHDFGRQCTRMLSFFAYSKLLLPKSIWEWQS